MSEVCRLWDLERKRFDPRTFIAVLPSADGKDLLAFSAERKAGTGEIQELTPILLEADGKEAKRWTAIRASAPVHNYDVKLHCSAGKRFLAIRFKIGYDHYSNWMGYRMDLQSGKLRELSGENWSEHIYFTGRGGELLRARPVFSAERKDLLERGDGAESGWQVALVPEGAGEEQRLWKTREEMHTRLVWPVYFFPDGERFALSLSFPAGPHANMVLDRSGKTTALPFMKILGSAEQGRLLIGWDGSRVVAVLVPEQGE